MRYSNTNENKKNGVVYTPVEMANYVANQMVKYKPFENSSEVSILDPAIGEGELIISMVNAICDDTIKIKIVGYETNKTVGRATQEKLSRMFPNAKIDIRTSDFLEAVELKNVEKFDYVIANPPYIRTQIMGSDRAQKIAQKLSLEGRVDIYYAFLIYTKEVLKPNGIAGYITSNKFMTIKAGSSVRNYMIEHYKMHHITDLGDTKLFSASVLPCILVFSLGNTNNGKQVRFTSIYQNSTEPKAGVAIENVFDAIHDSGLYSTPEGKSYKYQQGTLCSTEQNALWTINSDENEKWLSRVDSQTWMRFSDIGKIRVGIKTTADNVFIGDDWYGDRANIELLQPLITHRNAGQIIPNKNAQWKVLYTHKSVNGRKVAYNIEEFPNAKAYLLEHYEQLNSRNYIKKANRNWYEIWVPQNPDSWKHRKIVFRDISERPEFWLDETGAIVNGDCYWIDISPDVTEDVVYLALAVANSGFIERYYDIKFNTKLYSGKRRYQTQYVEDFPIPHYDTESARDAVTLVKRIIAEGYTEKSLSYGI